MNEQARTEVTHFRNSNYKNKMKRPQNLQNLCTKNSMYTKKIYVHGTAAVNLLPEKRKENM